MSTLTLESARRAHSSTIITVAVTYFINPIHRKRVNIKRHLSGTRSIQVLRPTKKLKTFSSGNILVH